MHVTRVDSWAGLDFALFAVVSGNWKSRGFADGHVRRKCGIIVGWGSNREETLALQIMDKVTRYEWRGSWVILFLLWILGIAIPFAVGYFTTNLLRIETEVADGTQLSEFLKTRK